MSFTFKKGSKLVIDDGLNRYQILVADFNFSETFIEKGYKQATLHNQLALDNRTFTNSKSNASFQFEMYLGMSKTVENKVLEWYGFSSDGSFPISIASLGKRYDLYIIMDNATVLIDDSVLENLSFKLDPRGALSLSVSGSGTTTLMQGVSPPSNGSLYSQTGFGNYPLLATIDNVPVNNLSGLTLELTKGVTWVNTETVHDALSNTLYIKDRITATNLSVSGSITKTKINSTEPSYYPDSRVLLQVGSYMTIDLQSCNITERVSTDSGVMTSIADYKLLDTLNSKIII